MKDNRYFPLIYFITSIFLYGVGFSSIFRLCKSDSWIVLLIGAFISLVLLPIYRKIINKTNKYIRLINLLFILLINMMILRIFTTSFYLTKSPGLLITIPFISLCLYNQSKGLNTIIKETNILYIFSIITILLNLLASTKTGSISFFTPILETSLNNIVKGTIYYTIYMLSPMILLTNINIESKSYVKAFIFTNLFLLFMSLVIIFVLGSNLISIYRFPEYMIYKEIYLFGFIENVENLVGLIYFLNLFITSSLCLYNINEITHKRYINILLGALILVITEIVSDKYKYSLIIYKYLPFILLIFILLYNIEKIVKKKK